MTQLDGSSFEKLLQTQIRALTQCQPKQFETTFIELATQILDWFELDRMTLFPNSMILLNDGKTLSVQRTGIPRLNKQQFGENNSVEYLKLLRARDSYQTFDSHAMQHSNIDALKYLYNEGGRWHGIIRLELFDQVWGALAFARFSNDKPILSLQEMDRLKMICDTFLVYWQHSTMTRSLGKDNNVITDESDKLLRLSKKQCAVLTLLAQGLTAKQCADQLFLSPRTIESHKYRMLDLLEFDTHTELIQFALRNGLVI